jgi:hypothetical protein
VDVSCYPTALVRYAVIELRYVLNPDVVHVAAVSYSAAAVNC